MSYFQLGVSYGNNVLQTTYVSASNYYLYYRSKSFVTSTSAANPINRGGVGIGTIGTGLSVVSLNEASPGYLAAGLYTVGDSSSEALLIAFLNNAPGREREVLLNFRITAQWLSGAELPSLLYGVTTPSVVATVPRVTNMCCCLQPVPSSWVH